MNEIALLLLHRKAGFPYHDDEIFKCRNNSKKQMEKSKFCRQSMKSKQCANREVSLLGAFIVGGLSGPLIQTNPASLPFAKMVLASLLKIQAFRGLKKISLPSGPHL